MSTKVQRFKGSGLEGAKRRKQLIADKGKTKGAWLKAQGERSGVVPLRCGNLLLESIYEQKIWHSS